MKIYRAVLFATIFAAISFFFQYLTLKLGEKIRRRTKFFFPGSKSVSRNNIFLLERDQRYTFRARKRRLHFCGCPDGLCRAVKRGGCSDEEKEERCDVIFIRENYGISYIYVNEEEGKGISAEANGTLESRNKIHECI